MVIDDKRIRDLEEVTERAARRLAQVDDDIAAAIHAKMPKNDPAFCTRAVIPDQYAFSDRT